MNLQDLKKICAIEKVVIDLESLGRFVEEFDPVLEVLTDRGFQIVLITPHLEQWNQWKDRCILLKGLQEARFNFLQAASQNILWVTDSKQLQKECIAKQLMVVCFKSSSIQDLVIECNAFKDLVALLDPSDLTAMQIAQELTKQKQAKPEQAMIIFVEGVENCGHAYFVSKLVEHLEQYEQFIEGIDLTELKTLESEYQYWSDSKQGEWILQEILMPFATNQRLLVENPPPWAVEKEIATFPCFLTPEMILVVWGTCLLTPDFQTFNSKNILLELSEKVATARYFEIDESENFDPKFIEKYQATEGRLYAQYLQNYYKNAVGHWKINFDNFQAFRIKS